MVVGDSEIVYRFPNSGFENFLHNRLIADSADQCITMLQGGGFDPAFPDHPKWMFVCSANHLAPNV